LKRGNPGTGGLTRVTGLIRGGRTFVGTGILGVPLFAQGVVGEKVYRRKETGEAGPVKGGGSVKIKKGAKALRPRRTGSFSVKSTGPDPGAG